MSLSPAGSRFSLLEEARGRAFPDFRGIRGRATIPGDRRGVSYLCSGSRGFGGVIAQRKPVWKSPVSGLDFMRALGR